MRKVISLAMSQYVKISMIPSLLDSLCESDCDIEKHVISDCFLLALLDEIIVGTIRISDLDKNIISEDAYKQILTKMNCDKFAYISRFAVLPDMQNEGVGSALFAAAQQHLINSGYNGVVLHTAINNSSLVGFYEKRLFRLIETTSDRGYERGAFYKQID